MTLTHAETQTLRAALRIECLKILKAENDFEFGGHSAQRCPLTIQSDCLLNPDTTLPARRVVRKIARQLIDIDAIVEAWPKRNGNSRRTIELHAIAGVCNESQNRGWLDTDADIPYMK
jgi:hypothetical protein